MSVHFLYTTGTGKLVAATPRDIYKASSILSMSYQPFDGRIAVTTVFDNDKVIYRGRLHLAD